MHFIVIMLVTSAVAAYGPPRPSTGGDGGCGSGCGSTGGGSQVVTTHVSPCPGGNCRVSSGSGGASSSGDYWWQGQGNPFASPNKPSPGSTSCSGSNCNSGGIPCAGSGCPSPSRPAPGPTSVQNLLIPPMGICSRNFVCVNWQLCRNGLAIADGTGIIDKQRKVIPPQLAASYDSCGGDMICCGLPRHPTQFGSGTPVRPSTSGTSHSPSPGKPARPHKPVGLPNFSGSGTPGRPHTAASPPHLSGPGSPTQPHTHVNPSKFSGPGSPAQPHTHVSPSKFSGPGTPAQPHTPISPPKFSGPGTPAQPGTFPRPQTSISPPKFSGSATPVQPPPQSAASPSYGYPSPNPQQPVGPSPLPSSVVQSRPVSPSQPLRPLSNPVGLPSPPSGQVGAMGGMGMMGMMGMMPRSGSCSAGTYCVAQEQCNPYTGFIFRGNNPVMAVVLDAPTVPLLVSALVFFARSLSTFIFLPYLYTSNIPSITSSSSVYHLISFLIPKFSFKRRNNCQVFLLLVNERIRHCL